MFEAQFITITAFQNLQFWCLKIENRNSKCFQHFRERIVESVKHLPDTNLDDIVQRISSLTKSL